MLIIADIDVAELEMLQGAQKTLARKNKPIWILEITSTNHQPQGISVNPNLIKTFNWFYRFGYSAKELSKNGRQIKSKDVENASIGHFTFKTQTFIFR